MSLYSSSATIDLAQQNDMETKTLIAEAISSNCGAASKVQEFRAIKQALQAGDCLKLDVISGGCANISYRVFLENSPTIQLYAKLSFSNPLLHLDPTFY